MLDRGYILLPQPIEEEALQMLRENRLEVVVATEASHDSVMPLMKDARAVVLRTGITLTEVLMEQADDLLTISRTGAGFDNIDIEAATKRGIIVTSSIGVNTSSVVEHCLALILSLFKQLFLLDREVRKGNFKIRYKNYPKDVEGKTLGVIGFGRIGSLLARKCHSAFGMKILAHDPYLDESARNTFRDWAEFVDFNDIFKRADVISVHMPPTNTTKGIIGIKQFGMMKPDAFIINTSRGCVVNEKDLIESLDKGTIAGAGLDVFEKEPIEPNNPLLTMANVLITPHAAALTKECVTRMAVSAVERVIDLLKGVTPPCIANPEVLKHERWSSLKKK